MKFKFLLLAGLFLLITASMLAQKKGRAHTDSLFRQLAAAKEDTNKANLLRRIGDGYADPKKTDSAVFYLQRALQLAEKLKWKYGAARLYNDLGYQFLERHDYTTAQNYLKKAVEANFAVANYELAFESSRLTARLLSRQNKLTEGIGYLVAQIDRFKKTGHKQILAALYVEIAGWYQRESDYNEAANYFIKAQAMLEAEPDKYTDGNLIINIASYYITRRQTDKAQAILLRAETMFKKTEDLRELADVYDMLSECALDHRDYLAFVAYSRKTAQLGEKVNYDYASNDGENSMAWGYFLMKQYDSAYVHAKRAFQFVKGDSSQIIRPLSTLGSIYREATPYIMKDAGLRPGQQYEKSVTLLIQSINYAGRHYDFEFANENRKELSLTYKKMHRYAEALDTYMAYITEKNKQDSSVNEKAILLRDAQLNYSRKEDSLNYKQNITNTQLKEKKQQSYFFIAGIAVLILLSVFIWRNFNIQRKSNKLLADANEQLNEQREEITAQRDQLSNTVADLKATQAQLIQSEKMASLGELTAGIAHEIQNPLNFVNNFSDVSIELLDEMHEELNKGDKDEAIAISEDIKQNLEKIRHHGKRADSIVKGMLQHSRASSGTKEPTNLNALSDEYLRLAYHGLRAKDKSFNAELVTNFDSKLPQIDMVPQDIGRVLLNLFTNAFYAVQQKGKITGEGYKPTVEINTSSEKGFAVVRVKDNGIGIPDDIKDKILQPFFTTKPTGEGTGLGLSMSYDIVVKAHGGTIDIKSTEGEYTEFTIRIPA